MKASLLVLDMWTVRKLIAQFATFGLQQRSKSIRYFGASVTDIGSFRSVLKTSFVAQLYSWLLCWIMLNSMFPTLRHIWHSTYSTCINIPCSRKKRRDFGYRFFWAQVRRSRRRCRPENILGHLMDHEFHVDPLPGYLPGLVNVNKKLWKGPPFLMGKSTISMAIFNSKLLN